MRRPIVSVGMLLWLAACGGDERGGMLPSATGGSAGAKAQVAEAPPASKADAPKPTEPALDPASKPQDMPMPQSQGAPMPQSMPAPQATPTPNDPTPAAEPSPPMMKDIAPPEGFKPNAMNECGLNTGWPGDQFCILPPPPGRGFQLHIGPSDYKNPEAIYLLQPGQENVHAFTAESANDKEIQFYVRQYRMRPGAHHTIVRDKSTGRRLSGANVNQDHPIGGITAPENAGVGLPLAAHSPLSVDHHAINTTDEPLLQEVWVNFWYVDPSKVTETTTLLYDPGSVMVNVPPHADVILGPYECDIKEPGRLISVFGHVHANNVRFSAWRTRAGKRDLIYESNHWEDPLWLEYTSLAKNPVADLSKKIDGGWSGILDLQPGDTLAWECHEVNQRDTPLMFSNKTYDGTMCIIIGDLVGTKCMSRSGAVIDPNLE